MSRNYTVKLSDGTRYEFSVNESESFTDFVNNVTQRVGLDEEKTFKFICKGKIVNGNTFLSLESGSIMLAMTSLKQSQPKQSVQSTEQTQSAQSVQSAQSAQSTQSAQSAQSAQSTESMESSKEPTYQYKHVKAAMVVFFDFIRNNPQLRHLYETNYTQLMTEILKNPMLDTVLKNVLSQSGQILSAMESGTNLKVNINGESGGVDQIRLTKEDEANIEEIIDMGFDATLVIKTYVENGNNKDVALEKLFAQK